MAGLSQTALRALAIGEIDSDFVIECQHVQFKVHRLILKAGSEFFRAICTNECRENKESRCEFPEDEPDTIGRVIQFLYTGSYPVKRPAFVMPTAIDRAPTDGQGIVIIDSEAEDSSDEDSEEDEEAAFMLCGRIIAELKKHTRVYQAADKLGIRELRYFSFGQIQHRYIEFVVDHPDYAGLLELAYNSTHTTDKGLRFWMTERTLNNPWFDSHERLSQIIKEHEHMAYRVWKRTKEIEAERERIREMELQEREKERQRQQRREQRPQGKARGGPKSARKASKA